MQNSFSLETTQTVSGTIVRVPETGKMVEIYAFHANDAAGGLPNGSKLGDATEIGSTGVYYHTSATSQKVTVVVDGTVRAGLVGVLFHGEKALANSVDSAAIEDATVTPSDTTFVEDF
jgi:hypothetical protein